MSCLSGEDVPYQSQNPALPGNGTLDLTVCDFGDNSTYTGVQDTINLTVLTGPFAGYRTGLQPVQGGNIQIQ
jgi:hypothetical protein